MNLISEIKSTHGFKPYGMLIGQICMVLAAFFAPISISFTNICIMLAIAASLVSGIFWSKLKWVVTHPLTLPIILLFVLLMAGLFWSIAPWPDRLSSLHKYAKLLYIPLLLPLCLDAKWRERALSGFLLAMGITVLLSFLKAYAGLSFGKYPMPSWVFHSHIETSYFVAFATYLLAHRACNHRPYRWMNWFLVAAFTYQEFFINDGRTGWTVYFLLLILFFVQQVASKNLTQAAAQQKMHHALSSKGLVFGLALVVILPILLYTTSAVFRTHIHYSLQSIENYFISGQQQPLKEHRLEFIDLSFHLIKAHPVFGLGTGAFQEAYRQSGGIPSWGPTLNNPHNEYLLMLVQLGFVGLIALLFFFYRQWRCSAACAETHFVGQALLFSFMLACCYNAFLYTTVTGHFYIIFSSLLFASCREQRTPVRSEASTRTGVRDSRDVQS